MRALNSKVLQAQSELFNAREKLKRTPLQQESIEYKSGNYFGELALLNDQPRSATVKCKTDCHFLLIEKKQFKELLQKADRLKQEELLEFLRQTPYLNAFPSHLSVKLSHEL